MWGNQCDLSLSGGSVVNASDQGGAESDGVVDAVEGWWGSWWWVDEYVKVYHVYIEYDSSVIQSLNLI